MKYEYQVFYGPSRLTEYFMTWTKACDFMKALLDDGWKNVSVEKI